LAGVAVDATVPLAPGPCEDWRGALKLRSEDPGRVRFAGAYSASCGEQVWPVAYADPRSYNARLLEQIWVELGGRLQGSVREGPTPAGLKPLAQSISPALAEVVRDINKFSNNVMTEQLFLSLALAQRGSATLPAPATVPSGASVGRSGPVTPDEARDVLTHWLRERLGDFNPRELVIDNGSGLSRETRISARLLGRLLQLIWAGPTMPEMLSSLPVSGLDGTLRRSQAPAGRAHLKTGSLKDVSAIAGYVLADSGKRYLVVGILNHKEAPAGRPVLDALVQWAVRDRPTPTASATSAAPG
jgi:D-alanyl-D-alanine carboxypeptidase/D-alanyl-D-alanine-endopeptidase (penicillin-binding protein 4)